MFNRNEISQFAQGGNLKTYHDEIKEYIEKKQRNNREFSIRQDSKVCKREILDVEKFMKFIENL